MLQSMGSQRVRHNWATELDWNLPVAFFSSTRFGFASLLFLFFQGWRLCSMTPSATSGLDLTNSPRTGLFFFYVLVFTESSSPLDCLVQVFRLKTKINRDRDLSSALRRKKLLPQLDQPLRNCRFRKIRKHPNVWLIAGIYEGSLRAQSFALGSH